MTCIPIYKSTEFSVGNRRIPVEEEDDDDRRSSSSSSLGRNSGESTAGRSSSGGRDADGDCEEVQSSFKGGGLDDLEALEEVLPINEETWWLPKEVSVQHCNITMLGIKNLGYALAPLYRVRYSRAIKTKRRKV